MGEVYFGNTLVRPDLVQSWAYTNNQTPGNILPIMSHNTEAVKKGNSSAKSTTVHEDFQLPN